MPRKRDTAAVQVLTFFRTAPYEVAGLVLELVQDEMRARKKERTDADEGVRQAVRGAAAEKARPSETSGRMPRRARRAILQGQDVPLPGIVSEVG